ncbi:class III signal peptide-containing protein [Methanothermobacter thermautotrophicus]|uniref:class III signal peptide-containing protein n=1 Tax=Methanothermobacter thermautotrophicus TaxID=145262 RepID=UPI003D7FCB08
MIIRDLRGQGGAEYILLFAAIIVIAVAALYIYSSYFRFSGNEAVDVKLTITNIGPSKSKFIYEANNTTGGGSRHIVSGDPGNRFFLLQPGTSRTFNLGRMSGGTSFTIEGGVGDPKGGTDDLKGIGQRGRWTLTIGNQTYSWVISGPYDYRRNPTGSVLMSFSISGGGGSPFKFTSDQVKVRGNVSG